MTIEPALQSVRETESSQHSSMLRQNSTLRQNAREPSRSWRTLLAIVATMALSGCVQQPPPEKDSSSKNESHTESPVETKAVAPAPIPQEKFVGSQVCATCHQEQFDTYSLSAHSQSLSIVDPDAEPADGEFIHDKSQHTFSIFRKDGELYHRDELTADGEVIAQAEHPLKYLIGSGKHSRSYLVEVDGFLMESPVTWYESKKRWSVSPGYDVESPVSFERAADVGCVVCHAGNVERVAGSLHRLKFHELSIGCERCHGAGGDHVDLAQAQGDQLLEAKPLEATHSDHPNNHIVHPGKLSRKLSEDICAQCHLRGQATTFLPGQSPERFRPGQALASNRIDYFFDSKNAQMSVVGHVEQMRLSRCYTQAETFTCTTCHDMHAPPPVEKASFFRNKCLTCHQVDSCGLAEDHEQRVLKSDNCTTCHMPQSETDIPHIAFTHHRVGIHDDSNPSVATTEQPQVSRLKPHQAPAASNQTLEDRNLGLAYLEVAPAQPSEAAFRQYFSSAVQRLNKYNRAHPGDGDVQAALAQVLMDQDPRVSLRYALSSYNLPSSSPKSKVNALLVQALLAYREQKPTLAIEPLLELQKLRRSSDDTYLLGLCMQGINKEEAIEHFRKASEIQPFRPDILNSLANLLRETGKHEEADEVEKRSLLLMKALNRNEPGSL
ncbi:hypothetical protein Mal48_46950 [Thalassoglobus polymorphus]|uniref:Cytochrome c-552/4 domain-containing protein n=2 Tax=Thalassoglobus polymorphus TaxID=2527994 RepID=A0A517QUV8_9PLAN|nr:hypothetical protein Mal48_46950 [Thalassoglobus polymorphus]